MKFTSFEQVMSYMERFMNLERSNKLYSSETYRLDRMRLMLERLGNPQNSYKTIHVAGSKGKGSTASYIAAGLKAAGFKTGLYMSPHVVDYRERFTIAGEFAPDEKLIEAGNILCEGIDGFTHDGNPTVFELYTCFAFILFKITGCSWAVIETGLGGRLDATNVIIPQASVLTPIELEHTDLLGNTITQIAGEKAKIIKHKRPCFISYQTDEAMKVFEEEAKEQESEIHRLKDEVLELTTSSTKDHQMVKLKYKDGSETTLRLKMLGRVQAENCALAILVLRTLGLFNPSKATEAMESNVLLGRMEKTSYKGHPVIIDGAHTVKSMANLTETFGQIFPNRNNICIFGAVSGKDHSGMAKLILSKFNTVIVSKPGSFKQNDPQALYELVKSLAKENQTVLLKEDINEALKWCDENSDSDTPLLVCGSFYLAGVAKRAINET